MPITNNDIRGAQQGMAAIFRAGDVLTFTAPSGVVITAGPYRSACERPAYALYYGCRRTVYRSPLHVAQVLTGCVGYSACVQAIAQHGDR